MTTTMDPRLAQLAEHLGVRITTHPGTPAGKWYHRRRVISLSRDLGPIGQRCTLAHELGHAALGHVSDPPKMLRDKQEAQAERYAAALLISEQEYALAERLYGPSTGAIAAELCVSTHMVDIWRKRIHRHSVQTIS